MIRAFTSMRMESQLFLVFYSQNGASTKVIGRPVGAACEKRYTLGTCHVSTWYRWSQGVRFKS
jgi:hypothetical protein